MSDIYTPELRLETTHKELGENIATVVGENRRLKASLAEVRAQKEAIHQQLATARRTFGEAFIKGDIRTGPSRPNRKKLSDQDAKDIRAAFRGGMKQRDLAKNYGVNPATISRLVRGIYH